MSENLKRAESLFNRIMNPNSSSNSQDKAHNSSSSHNSKYKYKSHNSSGHSALSHSSNSHSNYSNSSHNSHNNNSYDSNNHHNHNLHPNVDLPKRDPIKLSQEIISKIPPDHHILPYCWTIWHHSRSKLKKEHPEDLSSTGGVDSYLQTTNEIDFLCAADQGQTTTNSIGSIEQLWMSLSSIKKTYELPIGTELLIFKTGINPVWEDPINTKGGRWVFRFNRRSTGSDDHDSVKSMRKRTSLIWERLLLKTITGSIIPEGNSVEFQDLLLNDISGLVLSVRKDEDIISIWNSNLNFSSKNGKKEPDGKKLTSFQARRIICDSILRIIRECDLINQGSDCIETVDSGSNERVLGVSFEYRLHADNNNPDQGSNSSNIKYNGGSHHHHNRRYNKNYSSNNSNNTSSANEKDDSNAP